MYNISNPQKNIYECVENVILPEGLTSIRDKAFFKCVNLKTITLPQSLISIGKSVFAGCKNLTIINLPKNLTNMGEMVFAGCESLTEIKLPEGLKNISNKCFHSCINLRIVNLPEGLTSIGESAFYNCESLTKITLPQGLTNIGIKAFCFCNNLTEIIFKERLESIGEKFFNNNNNNINLKKVKLSSYLKIEDEAFSMCNNLERIYFPDGLISIGNKSFYNCEKLEIINFSEGLKTIGNEAFNKCKILKKINFPEGLTSIGESAFSGCYDLKINKFPEGLTSIGNSAFENCYSITKITLPEGLTSISEKVFMNCQNLFEINFPKNLTSIGNEAFENCLNLTKITLSEGLTIIGESAFRNCMLQEITLPKSLTSIGESVFAKCKYLMKINLPENLTSISNNAFFECENLGEITFSEGLKSIGDNAFYKCELREITFPKSLETIGKGTFMYCQNLRKITFPEGLISIGEQAFMYCRNLKYNDITISDNINLLSIESDVFKFCDMTDAEIKKLYNILKNSNPDILIRIIKKEKTSVEKNKEESDKLLFHPILNKSALLKEKRDIWFKGYEETCNLINGYDKNYKCILSSNYILNKNKKQGQTIRILNQIPEDIYKQIIEYLSEDSNLDIYPYIQLGNAIDVGGSSREVATKIGEHLKYTYLTNLNKNNDNLSNQLSNQASNNTIACAKDKIDTNIKMFDISKLFVNYKNNSDISYDNLINISKILYFFMFTMSPLSEFKVSLGIKFSDFTLMMIFNMFNKLGEKKKLSDFIIEVKDYVIKEENNYFKLPEEETETPCKSNIGDFAYNPDSNNSEKRSEEQKILDNRLEYYIGMMNLMNESLFEKENEESMNLLNIQTENGTITCLGFPIIDLLNKIIFNLYNKTENNELTRQIASIDFEDLNEIKLQFIPIIEDIIKRLKLLELIGNNILDFLGSKADNFKKLTDNNSICLYDLSYLIHTNFDVTSDNIKQIIEFESTDEEKKIFMEIIDELYKNDNKNLLHFLQFITGSVVLPNKIKIKFTKDINGILNAHTCFNSLDIANIEIYNTLESDLKGTSYKNFLYERLLAEILEKSKMTIAGGNRIKNNIKNKKISNKYIKNNRKTKKNKKIFKKSIKNILLKNNKKSKIYKK